MRLMTRVKIFSQPRYGGETFIEPGAATLLSNSVKKRRPAKNIRKDIKKYTAVSELDSIETYVWF